MNGYLSRKCRSEQQLMNDLTKLVTTKDFASKKMSDLMTELGFFYASSKTQPQLPHSVLKDLCTLLSNLKDKKEDLRIARFVLCYLWRIVDQFEWLRHHASESTIASLEVSASMLRNLIKLMETTELNHTSLPRQCTCLKFYAHLCRIFNQPDALLMRLRPLLQKSPVWGMLTGDKKVIAAVTGKKDFPAQLAALGAAFHSVRFHLAVDQQEQFLESLFQAAFLPNSIASRHAAATLLQLFEQSKEFATAVVKAFEWFVVKFRPASLRVGDVLATTYLLRLCGQINRLPLADSDSKTATFGTGGGRTASSTTNGNVSNLLDFSFDSPEPTRASASPPSPPPSPIRKQLQRLDGVMVSSLLSGRLKDWFLDILSSATEATNPTPKAIMLATVEEVVRESNAEACFMKVYGNATVFEVVAAVILKMFKEVATNVVLLHRLCRVAQFTAECLDGAVLQMSGAASQPQFLNQITDHLVGVTGHENGFIACESLRALVWLLPRTESFKTGDSWDLLMQRLVGLPVGQVYPEAREAIAEAFYRRAVTNPSLHQRAVDMAMLQKCLVVTLTWFQVSPCEWHASMLVKIWQTGLRKCGSAIRDDVFHSINTVLDFQHQPLRTITERVTRSTLIFLTQLGAKYAVHNISWFRPLLLRLTKQILLESLVSRRLGIRVLTRLHQEAQQLGKTDIVQQLVSIFQYLQRTIPDEYLQDLSQQNGKKKNPPGVVMETQIHSVTVKHSLGIQDLLVTALETRASMPTTASSTSFSSANTSTSVFSGIF